MSSLALTKEAGPQANAFSSWDELLLEETIATMAAFRLEGNLSQALMTAFKSLSNAQSGSCEAPCECCFASL